MKELRKDDRGVVLLLLVIIVVLIGLVWVTWNAYGARQAAGQQSYLSQSTTG